MREISNDVIRLETLLRAEEDLYLRLRAVLRREESELIELDPIVVGETVEEKRALAEEGRLLEESRSLVACELGAALGLEDRPPRLSTIIAALGEDARDLAKLHGRLTALVQTTRSLIEANEQFANRSLARVQETLRLLGRSVPEEVGYGRGTAASNSAGRGRLVRQAI